MVWRFHLEPVLVGEGGFGARIDPEVQWCPNGSRLLEAWEVAETLRSDGVGMLIESREARVVLARGMGAEAGAGRDWRLSWPNATFFVGIRDCTGGGGWFACHLRRGDMVPTGLLSGKGVGSGRLTLPLESVVISRRGVGGSRLMDGDWA